MILFQSVYALWIHFIPQIVTINKLQNVYIKQIIISAQLIKLCLLYNDIHNGVTVSKPGVLVWGERDCNMSKN